MRMIASFSYIFLLADRHLGYIKKSFKKRKKKHCLGSQNPAALSFVLTCTFCLRVLLHLPRRRRRRLHHHRSIQQPLARHCCTRSHFLFNCSSFDLITHIQAHQQIARSIHLCLVTFFCRSPAVDIYIPQQQQQQQRSSSRSA